MHFDWRLNDCHHASSIHTVDLIISSVIETSETLANDGPFFHIEDDFILGQLQNSTLAEFLQDHIRQDNLSPNGVFKLILPAAPGYVARSDMVDFRFTGCKSVSTVRSFLRPLQHVKRFDFQESENQRLHLRAILDATLAVLVPKQLGRSIGATLAKLEPEIANRLSIQWISPDPIPARRVAIVSCSQEDISYMTLKSMGIGLVVLDRPGHYLEDPNGPEAHLREAFCELDLNPDETMPRRIVEALKRHPVDAIYTRYEVFHQKVAIANQLLGLPAVPLDGIRIATDKFATRMLEADSNSAVCVQTADELIDRLRDEGNPLQVRYPVVVKPCLGCTSWSVVKADNEVELIASVRKAHSRVIGYEGKQSIHPLIMVEPYVSGPEFDVNIALLNGEMLFYDVSDNFPTAGDSTVGAKDFQETLFVYPTVLLKSEQEILAASLHQSLLRMGFRTGVFHVEARLQNSSMQYAERNGILDLIAKPTSSSLMPSAFMIEVNPRPAGYMGLQAVTWTHGVDYYALHVLSALKDDHRFRAFATPFLDGPQHWSTLLLIMPEKGGILTSSDPAIKLQRERPDLMKYITLYRNIFQKGERVKEPDAVDMTFLSTMVVTSNKSRCDVLQASDAIRDNWHAIIE